MSGKMGRAFRAMGVALTAGALLFGGVNASAAPAPAEKAPAAEPLIEITDQNYEQLMAQSHEKPFIIDFGKEGCIPCEKLKPVLEERQAADKDAVTIGHLDGTKYPKLWEKYGKPFFPTLIGIVDGKEIARHTGYDGNADYINKWIDDVIAGTPPPPTPTEMDVTSANEQEVLEISKSKPVIMDFGAEWCGPCQELKPVISGFAKDDNGKWMLGKVDADKSPELVEKYKIEGYPTLVVFYNGVPQSSVVPNHVGYNGDPASVRAFVDKALSTQYPPPGTAAAPAKPATVSGDLVAAR